MKKIKLFILLSMFQLSLNAQVLKEEPSFIQNKTFTTGELLLYSISYGFIDAGTATLYVDLFKEGNTDIYHIKALAQTTKLSEKIFNIHDIYESYVEVESGLPIMAVRNIQEEKYLYYDETRFDRKKKQVNSMKNGIVTVPDSILDILSAFYYARRFKFDDKKIGEKMKFTTYFDDEIFTFTMIYKGIEIVKTKFGYLECKKFTPIVATGRLFKKNDAVSIWITNDNNRIPVKIQMKMVFGSANCNLIEYSGVANPLLIEKNKKNFKKEK